ncbi:hypothetical protein AAZV13_09G091400 [Glycine max]
MFHLHNRVHLHPHPFKEIQKSCSKGTLTDAQRFPVAFINGNLASKSPYSEFISIEPVERETISVQAPTWTKYDYEHTSSEAFKALPTDVIVYLPLPQWTCQV